MDEIYENIVISKRIVLNVHELGTDVRKTLSLYLQQHYEGHCEVDGYIQPNSTNILSFSSGCITNGNEISFIVVFECFVCCPCVGLVLTCKVKSITNAGIRCEAVDETPSPIVVHIAKETCSYNQELQTYYNTIAENDIIRICVLGKRFELYDNYISVIAELLLT